MNSKKKVNFNKYKFSKWSNNIEYEKTTRINNNNNNKSIDVIEHALSEELEPKNINNIKTNFDRLIPDNYITPSENQNAHQGVLISKSLGHSQFISPHEVGVLNSQWCKQNNKREGQNEKLVSRGMMIQKNINPFLDTSHYIKHLNEEQQYLRPKDSNFE